MDKITLKEWKELANSNPEKLFVEKGAESYIPLMAKLDIIELAVHNHETEVDGKTYTVPPMCIDIDENGYATINPISKLLFLMQIYLSLYFNVSIGDAKFSTSEYDDIIRHGYQSKINRLESKASTPKIKWAVINQQNDFKAFEKLLNKELADEIARLNDPYRRIMERIEAEITPERVKQATEELKQLTSRKA